MLKPAKARKLGRNFKIGVKLSFKSQPSLSLLGLTNTVYCICYSLSSSWELEYISAKGSEGHLSLISFNTNQKPSKTPEGPWLLEAA